MSKIKLSPESTSSTIDCNNHTVTVKQEPDLYHVSKIENPELEILDIKGNVQMEEDLGVHESNMSIVKSEVPETEDIKQEMLPHVTIKDEEFNVLSEDQSRLSNTVVQENEKKYKCFMCDYQEEYERTIMLHVMGHVKRILSKNVKKYRCPGCSSKFKNKFYLKRHLRSHLTVRQDWKYFCSGCNYKTNSPFQFNKHNERHWPEKNKTEEHFKIFTCVQCKHEAFSKSDIRTHLMQHMARNPVENDHIVTVTLPELDSA